MLKNISLSIIFLFISFVVLCNQNYKIVDKYTKEELAGVKIIINNDTLYSDLNGNFTYNVSDSSEIKISYISYTSINFLLYPSDSIIELK
jgi:hypothetical protein